jgi:hypothetical protein
VPTANNRHQTNRHQTNRHQTLLHSAAVVLGFSLLFTLFFAPVLFSEKLLAPGDGVAYYIPAFYSAKTLWTNLIFGGYPIAADSQNMTWYPPALILSLFPHSWNLFVLSAYVLAASFAYCYAYTVTASPLAGAVSGLVYSMSGFMLSHLGHAGMIHPAVWIPLIVTALERLRQRLEPMWVAIGAVAVACCCLGGHPQIFVYGVGTGLFYALFLGWIVPMTSDRSETVGRWQFYRYACGILLGGLGLAAIQLLPTWELSRLSVRADLNFEAFVTFSLPIQQVLQLLFPYFFGSGFPSPHHVYQTDYWGKWDLSEISGYVGLLPLILAGIGAVAYPQRAVTRFWIGFGLITLLLSFGGDLPLGQVLYHVPVYSKFRAQGRHLIEVALAVAALAGFGVAAIAARSVSKRLMRQTIAISLGLMLVSLLSMAVFYNAFQAQASHQAQVNHMRIAPLNFLPWANNAVAIPLGIFGASLVVLLAWYRWLKAGWTALLLLLVVTLDLASFGWFFNWQVSPPLAQHLQSNSIVQKYRDRLQPQHQRFMTAIGNSADPNGLYPNLTRLWDFPMASGYSPLTLMRVSQMMQMSAGGVLANIPVRGDRRLDLMAVRYLMTPLTGMNLPISPPDPQAAIQGVAWGSQDLQLTLGSGTCSVGNQTAWQIDFPQMSPLTTEIGLVTAMGCAVEIPNQAKVLTVQVTNTHGQVETHRFQAGQDTAEATHDCPDVQPQMKHRRATVFNSGSITRPNGATCQAHQYVSFLKLDQRQQIKRLTLQTGQMSAVIGIQRMSLIDRDKQRSTPVVAIDQSQHWQKVEQLAGGIVYENRQALPRTWLVSETIPLSPTQILTAIHTGRLPDGRTFVPKTMALVENGKAHLQGSPLTPTDTAKVRQIGDTDAEIQTRTATDAFLVLSDVNYPGWRATIDGRSTRIFATNYIQRGVKVPAGEHVIRFEFRPLSFNLGAGIAVATSCGLAYWVYQRQCQPHV